MSVFLADSARAAEALPLLVEAARLGGEIALRDFRLGATTTARIDHKHGGSPVTTADLAVDNFLKTRLEAAFPEAGWLSEETVDDSARRARRELLIVDPIDGTRAFVSGDPRWTVSIALVAGDRPVAGVVHAPSLGQTYAAALGNGATLNGLPIRAAALKSLEGARVGGPKPMVTALAASTGSALVLEPRIPSLAYRFALVASGHLDIALASVDSHDWDIAAADVILAESGAGLSEDGLALMYNRDRVRRRVLLAAPEFWLPALGEALAKPALA